MNVLHFDLCRVCFKRCFLNKVSSTVREAQRAKFRFKLYSYYAWGIPIGLVTGGHVSAYFQPLEYYNPHYATNYCFLNGKNGLAMYLALPMATLLLENGLFIAVTVICLLQNHRQAYIQGNSGYPTSEQMNSLTQPIWQIPPVHRMYQGPGKWV